MQPFLGQLADQSWPGLFMGGGQMGYAVQELHPGHVAVKAASDGIMMRSFNEAPGHFKRLLVFPNAARGNLRFRDATAPGQLGRCPWHGCFAFNPFA